MKSVAAIRQPNVKIQRVDEDLPLPEFKTDGSIGMDVCAREEVLIKDNETKLVPLNIIIKSPRGLMVGLLPRSSTFKKKGLILTNSLGVIDWDYCGPDDEVMASVHKLPKKDGETGTVIEKGERLFQLVFFNVQTPNVIEVEEISSVNRDGFGSTDEDEE